MWCDVPPAALVDMSRDVVGDAIGRLIFLKLSQEQRKELFQKVPASGPNWGVI